MKKIILSFLISLPLSAAGYSNCQVIKNYERCEKLIYSEHLKQEVPVFVFKKAESKTKGSIPIVFLHGRGYARRVGEKNSMLEAANLEEIFDKNGDDFVFIAPQDTVVQEDNGQIGNDYWIGNSKRNWPAFISQDLISDVKKEYPDLDYEKTSVLGISMGAHGSLMNAALAPEVFKRSMALSPVFRSTKGEIPEMDCDVFYRDGAENLENYSIGTQLLRNESVKLPFEYYIEIDHHDFGLDAEKFPSATIVWKNLKKRSENSEQDVIIFENGSGHSMNYWKDALPRSLSWLKKSFLK